MLHVVRFVYSSNKGLQKTAHPTVSTEPLLLENTFMWSWWGFRLKLKPKVKKTIIITLFLKKWAATRDIQQCGILRNVDSDEPVQPSVGLETSNDIRSVAWQSWSIQATSKGSDQTARMRRLVWAFAGRTYLIVGILMFRLIYVRHCLCNALYVYCRGRAVTNVGKTCCPTPCFVLAINTFKLN